jgi:mannose-6-phosphate isomerase-like protein (cupin superfamily)
MVQLRHVLMAGLLSAALTAAAERKVDPSFLRRHIPDVKPATTEMTTETCEYQPLFGAGDTEPGIVRGVARFGVLTVKPGGACNEVRYASDEQVYVVTAGGGTLRQGAESATMTKEDFLYVPPGTAHRFANSGTTPLRLFVMGFKVPAGAAGPDGVSIANLGELKKQTVGGHPDSVLYQLMIGDVKSKRDRIAAGRVLTSLYVMEFAPGGTNFPHHHDNEEEIYVLLEGSGEMVAGSGMNGIEGRYPAKAGDAYFFRLNCTVGFYNAKSAGARILAVRSLYPRRN